MIFLSSSLPSTLFSEHLLYARHCAGARDPLMNNTDKGSILTKLTVGWEMFTQGCDCPGTVEGAIEHIRETASLA